MSNIKFTDTLEVTASHGRLAKAAQIYDDEQKATQAALNKKFLAYTPGTDFTSIVDTDAEDHASAINELADKHVLKGQLIRNAGGDWYIGDEDTTTEIYPTNTIFLVLKDLVKSSSPDFDEYLLPIVPNASSIVCQFNYMQNLVAVLGEHIDAIEAKLKV